MANRLLVTLDFHPELGGIQSYLAEIVSHTYDSCDLVLVGTSAKLKGAQKQFPCRVHYCRTPLSLPNKKVSILPLLLCTWAHIRKQQFRTVDCGNIYAAIVPFLLSWFVPIRYGVYTYGTEITGLSGNGITSRFLKRVLRGAERIYVLGSYTEALLRRSGIVGSFIKVPPRIAPHGLQIRKNIEIATSSIELLSVGRLVRHKGHDCLLRAVALLPLTIDWHLTIIGDGPQKAELAALLVQLGIGEKVDLCGRVDDLALERHYRKASLFIFPSREDIAGTEGFGIVLLEAMNHGIPIVASRSGGIPEVLDEGRCGELVEADDPGVLASSIEKLACSEELRLIYVDRAFKRLRECYVW